MQATSPWCGDRPWQKAYRRYRELETELTSDTDRRPLRVLLNAAVGTSFSRTLTQYEGESALPQPSPELLDELRALANLRSGYDSDAKGFEFEDVYHFAFDMLVESEWRRYGERLPEANEPSLLYRGQRRADWLLEAPIYRELAEVRARADELRKRATEACQIGFAIQAARGCSFDDAMAIAQHYASELKVITWLVDFTRNPWVALYFASHRGEDNFLGVHGLLCIRPWGLSLSVLRPFAPNGAKKHAPCADHREGTVRRRVIRRNGPPVVCAKCRKVE